MWLPTVNSVIYFFYRFIDTCSSLTQCIVSHPLIYHTNTVLLSDIKVFGMLSFTVQQCDLSVSFHPSTTWTLLDKKSQHQQSSTE